MRVVFDTSVLVAAVRSRQGASFALAVQNPSRDQERLASRYPQVSSRLLRTTHAVPYVLAALLFWLLPAHAADPLAIQRIEPTPLFRAQKRAMRSSPSS